MTKREQMWVKVTLLLKPKAEHFAGSQHSCHRHVLLSTLTLVAAAWGLHQSFTCINGTVGVS